MNIHILASNENCQSSFLDITQPQEGRSVEYLCFDNSYLKVCDLLKQKGCSAFQVTPLSNSEKESVLVDYLNVMPPSKINGGMAGT